LLDIGLRPKTSLLAAAATHHRGRTTGSTAPFTRSLATEVAGALLNLGLRPKIPLLAAPATHHRLSLLRPGSATERVLSIAILAGTTTHHRGRPPGVHQARV